MTTARELIDLARRHGVRLYTRTGEDLRESCDVRTWLRMPEILAELRRPAAAAPRRRSRRKGAR